MKLACGFKAVSFSLTLLLLPALAEQKGWEKEWADIVAAARKEGRVVVEGTPDAVTRREIPARFQAKFGIPVEYMAGRGGEVAAKLRAERRAGLQTIDVFLSGMDVAYLIDEKILAPVKPILILPDVVDGSKWKRGSPWFMDPEEKYILRLFNYVSDMLHINTNYVKPEEIRSVKDLLNPKWMGKISADDPTVSGPGGNTAAIFYRQFGEEFVKKLYVDQKPVITQNRRQQADWLARGTYPISLDAASGEVKRLQQEGFPLHSIYSLADAPGRISGGGGLINLINNAPHPNAARVFINWLASREGLEVYSRSRLIPTTRNDVDESFLPAEIIPRPGVNYFDGFGWTFYTTEREKIRLRMKDLLKR
jgi:iron(III) transport system substrate-binding protein